MGLLKEVIWSEASSQDYIERIIYVYNILSTPTLFQQLQLSQFVLLIQLIQLH